MRNVIYPLTEMNLILARITSFVNPFSRLGGNLLVFGHMGLALTSFSQRIRADSVLCIILE
jgi:hypothetical protein